MHLQQIYLNKSENHYSQDYANGTWSRAKGSRKIHNIQAARSIVYFHFPLVLPIAACEFRHSHLDSHRAK